MVALADAARRAIAGGASRQNVLAAARRAGEDAEDAVRSVLDDDETGR